jgi:very-short-patch-repair endonuclease
MVAGDVKRALEAGRVDGAVPATAETVALCQQAMHLAQLRWALRTRWLNQVAPFTGPDLDPYRPEDTVGTLHDQLAGVLDTPARWQQLTGELASLGVTTRGDYSSTTIARLRLVTDLAATRASERAVTAQLDALAAYLSSGTGQANASPLWQLLSDALASELSGTWHQHRRAVSDLVEISAAARRLADLGDRLHRAAPVWTNAIYADPSAADPATLAAAWQWRQLDTWVSAVAAGDDPQQLQLELEQLTTSRRRLVAELVGVQAWRRLADNLGDRQRQALNRYLAATKRYGKTGGKFAARWLAEIRAALNDSKDAVPVWIMTTARALASFRPDAQAPFDVLIIDEASQIGIEALPLLSLAKRAIVVGDDKQTSPGAVGVDQQSVFELIDAHLADVPGHRVMFNPGNSLYDLARQKFPSLVMLREHFRCLPEIIAFSNRFYGDKIEPLREDRPAPGWAALGAVKVLDGYLDRRTDTNEPEANVVTDLVAKMIDDPAYDGMDFGVVCLRAGAQTELINRKLFDRLGPQIMTERRLRVGDAPNFQGDERDVIVVATVVGTDPANPTGRIGAMTSADAEQRINVAASRARNQMIVVHSVDPERFPTNDLRAALIRHCRAPLGPGTDTADALANCDSEFERMVLRRIIDRGYARVRSQVHVGTGNHSYRIDLVVDGPESRLAVECDGERWHGEERWHADRARQEVLERAGWKFCRIRGSAFFRDPDAALEPLWQRLEELEIPTGNDWLEAGVRPRPTVVELRGSDRAADESADSSDEYIDANTSAASPTERTVTPVAAGEPDRPAPAAAPISFARNRPRRSSRAVQTTPARNELPQQESANLPAPPSPAPVAAEGRHRAGAPTLAPYARFHGGPFVPVALDTRSQVAAGLREIVAAEGPILALRAYQLYVFASGGHRVGSEIKRILNKVTQDQIRNGRIARVDEPASGMIDRTLYLPDTAPVVVRELGPRDLLEVPKSEVHALIVGLGMIGDGDTERVSRAVLTAYGLSRLGSRAAEFLLECQRYSSKQV